MSIFGESIFNTEPDGDPDYRRCRVDVEAKWKPEIGESSLPKPFLRLEHGTHDYEFELGAEDLLRVAGGRSIELPNPLGSGPQSIWLPRRVAWQTAGRLAHQHAALALISCKERIPGFARVAATVGKSAMKSAYKAGRAGLQRLLG